MYVVALRLGRLSSLLPLRRPTRLQTRDHGIRCFGTRTSAQHQCSSPSQQPRVSRKWTAGAAASPSRKLLSPFGSVLQGPSRGPQGFFIEPLDAWLAVLADAVPFYRDCLVVCPSTTTGAQLRGIRSRCQSVINAAKVSTLVPRERPATLGPGRSNAVTQGERGPSLMSSASSTEHETASPAVLARKKDITPIGNSETRLAAALQRLPALQSPLENVPAASLDLVVFAHNAFAHDLLFDAPWHLSMAHRALRPHGVIAIMGHSTEAAVTSPEWASADSISYIESTHNDARERLTFSGSSLAPRFPDDEQRVQSLKRAVEMQETLRIAHADVFFPFPSVRRRWFTSEYALSPSELVAHYRAAPIYQELHGPEGELWWSNLQHKTEEYTWQRHHHPEFAVLPKEDDFFVDVTLPPSSGVLGSTAQRLVDVEGKDNTTPAQRLLMETLAAWSPPGVRRRRGVVDPLEVLHAILETHIARTGTSTLAPSLRAEVQHFVVTCSARSMNAAPAWESSTPLPGQTPRALQ